MRARLDVIGVLTLAALAGLGGGITRDVILGATPPVGISDWKLLLPAAIANVFITAAAVLADPSLQLLAWIGVAEIVAIFGVTLAAARPQPAAHGHGHGHGHDDAHGHAAHAAGH